MPKPTRAKRAELLDFIETLQNYLATATYFIDQQTGEIWVDIPFHYQPFWDAVSKKRTTRRRGGWRRATAGTTRPNAPTAKPSTPPGQYSRPKGGNDHDTVRPHKSHRCQAGPPRKRPLL